MTALEAKLLVQLKALRRTLHITSDALLALRFGEHKPQLSLEDIVDCLDAADRTIAEAEAKEGGG